MSAVRHLSEEDGSDGRKPMNPKHLRRTLYWLALDWIHLRDAMPSPMRGTDSGRRSNSRVYGHPAEWASDKAAEITDLLSSWHDLMAEHRNEKPPPRGVRNAVWSPLGSTSSPAANNSSRSSTPRI